MNNMHQKTIQIHIQSSLMWNKTDETKYFYHVIATISLFAKFQL